MPDGGRYVEDPAASRQFAELNKETTLQLLLDIQEDAERYVPVLTGDLRNSIGHEQESDTSGIVYADEEYAAAVENGYVHHRSGDHIPAQPYLRPALYKQRGGS